MPKFSANISTLFREYPLLERITQAAAAGFDAIEVQFPYDEDPELFRRALDNCGLPLVLMNFPAGDLMHGGEGLAAVPGREAEFDTAIAAARSYAELLRPAAMNLLAGRPAAHHRHALCAEIFASNLRKAHAMTSDLGITLVTEPVNTVDLPGFFLRDTRQTLALIEALSDIELKLQYDVYHVQIMEGDAMARLPPIIEQVAHIQFSDVPGRTEPGLGKLDFVSIFALIDSLDYPGYVGAEYFPSVATEDTLEWLRRYRRTRENP